MTGRPHDQASATDKAPPRSSSGTAGESVGTTADVAQAIHKPDAKRVGSHCRVDCSCGWRGPTVPMFAHGHEPWAAHLRDYLVNDPGVQAAARLRVLGGT